MGLAKRKYIQATAAKGPAKGQKFPTCSAQDFFEMGQSLTRARCHTWGLKTVYTGQGLQFFASGWSHGARSLPEAFHINLASDVEKFTNTLQTFGVAADSPLAAWAKPLWGLEITWPDYDIPALPRAFWFDLIEYLKAQAAHRPAHNPLPVVTVCLGGHGRTGTAVSIMLGLLGIRLPIDHVRAVYCERAVETDEQEDYVEQVLGRKAWSIEPFRPNPALKKTP